MDPRGSHPLPVARRAARCLAGALALLAFRHAAANGATSPDGAPPPPRGVEEVVLRINALRTAAGATPLRLETHLSALAQRRADAQARAGILHSELGTESVLQAVQRGGYEAFMIAELLASGDGLAGIFADWQTRGSGSYDELLAPQERDVGVGIAEHEGTTFVALFLSLAWPDYFADRTRGLADIELVRRQMLQRTNVERRQAGRPALALEPRLVQCAQRYADLMLARSHYAHRGPDGDTIRERAERSGYVNYLALGENLAQGQYSVQEVMDGWMQSPGHRENLLSPGFRDVGFGLAYGHNGNGWQVLWVQCFGQPRSP